MREKIFYSPEAVKELAQNIEAYNSGYMSRNEFLDKAVRNATLGCSQPIDVSNRLGIHLVDDEVGVVLYNLAYFKKLAASIGVAKDANVKKALEDKALEILSQKLNVLKFYAAF